MMATTFEVIYLGTLPRIDTAQGNEVVENAAGILGTYGTANDPLSSKVQALSAERLSEDDNDSYDLDNGGGYDSFRINGGAPQEFDAVAIYDATITYADGTTTTITAVVFQDVNGNTYLVPEETANVDQAALTAKPIASLTLNSVASDTGDPAANRVAGDFISSVDGTAGNDTMNVGYIDAQGDQIGSGNDFIVAGNGDDSVSSGGGADTLFGGTGADTMTAGDGDDILDGGDGNDSIGSFGLDTGNDTMRGGAGDDTIRGGLGDDLIKGDAGNDNLSGGQGSDTVFGGEGNDLAAVAEDHGTDVYDLGEHPGDWDTIWFGNYQSSTGVTVTFTGTDAGTYAYTGGGATGSFSGAEQVDGTDNADTINAAADTDGGKLLGNGGADSITGGSGNDTIWGGADNDTVFGGAGLDSLMGGTGNDQLSGGDGDDRLLGDGGDDTLSGGIGNDTLEGSDGNDSVLGNDGNDSLDGNEGNDSLFGGVGADTIEAGIGNDLVYGGNDVDYINGRDGDDSLYGDAGSDTIEGGEGADLVSGDAGNDQLFGGGGNDTLFGGAGIDALSGGTGNDVLFGGDFSDSFNIGANEGTDSIVGGEAGYDFDTLILTGGAGGVSVTFTGAEAGTYLHNGGSGTFSEIEGVQTADQADTIDGSANTANMTVWSGAGNDSVNTGSGNDYVDAGDGNDTVSGGAGADTINAGSGNDLVHGGDGNDTLSGGMGLDTLFGGAGNDTLDGGDGDDTLVGGAGADVLNGGAGRDTADYSASGQGVTVNLLTGLGSGGDAEGDTLAGMDNVIGSSFGDVLTLHNTQGNLFGGAGDDSLFGGTGNGDNLYGGEGNDLIAGGAGADSLFGGSGADTLVASGSDTVSGGEEGDDWDVLRVAAGGTVTYGGGNNEAGTISWNDGTVVTFAGIEQIEMEGVVDGTRGDDVIDAGYIDAQDDAVDGADGEADVIMAGAGNDTVNGMAADDTVYGGAGDDFVSGGAGSDVVHGDAGADTVVGMTGNDTLSGGGGNDVVAGLWDDDSLDGGSGTDTAVFVGDVTEYSFGYDPSGALIVTDSVAGRDGADTISGFEYVEFNGVTYHLVTGDDGSNTTLQGPGDGTPSIIIAHDGNDWGGGHATSDVIFGGAGDDTLDGGNGDDTLVGEGDNDLLRGDGGNDSLLGGDGADTLEGGNGDDTLDGGAGNDQLKGGEGTDSLTGGTGDDSFVLTRVGGTDTVADFDMTLADGQTADQLDVSDLRTPDGDPITWRDVVVTDTVGDGSGDAVLTFPNGEVVILEGVSPDEVNSKQAMASVGIPCFAAGTHILTPTGWTKVEALHAGSIVLTMDGPQPVIWAARRQLSADDLTLHPDWTPVHFPVGAIGNTAALRLSPQHAVLMTHATGAKVLVRAKHLAETGFGGARVETGCEGVVYHHVFIGKHAILCAEGAATESFYPGPAAMAMLDWPARIAITAAIVGGRGHTTLPHLSGIAEVRCPRLSFDREKRAVNQFLDSLPDDLC